MRERKRLSQEEIFALFACLLESSTAPAIAVLRGRLTPQERLIGTAFEWILLRSHGIAGGSSALMRRRPRQIRSSPGVAGSKLTS
jgi:hypothetical protein